LSDALAPPRHRLVTTTDMLKFVGVATLLVDHYGLFYHPDENAWRLVGRTAAPIFFFLIGFARTRSVPWTWLAFGAAITVMSAFTYGGWRNATVNILFNFALLRVAVLPLVERHLLSRPLPLAMLSAGCVLLIPATDEALEYSTEGWLWAFFGLAHREALEDSGRRTAWTRAGLAAVAALAYIQREIHDYGFDAAQSVVLALLVGTIVLSLIRFRRAALPVQPPAPLASALRVCGRYSLEIYGISLLAMQAHSLFPAAPETEDRG
jgi:TraX protein